MAIIAHYSGEVTIPAADDTITITLPATVDPTRAIAVIQSRNIGDSTYGGSAGNCLFTPAFVDSGATLQVDRVKNWQQSMGIVWDVIEWDQVVEVTRTEISLDTNPVAIPFVSTNGAYFPILDLRGGAGPFTSKSNEWNMRAEPVGDFLYIFHDAPAGATAVVQIVDYQSVSGIDGIDRYENAGMYGGSGINHVVENTTLDKVILIPTYEINAMDNDARDQMVFNAVQNGANVEFQPDSYGSSSNWWEYSGFAIKTLDPIVQNGNLVMTNSQTDVTLTTPAKIENSMASVIGSMLNYGSPNTYTEEFGDFSISAKLVDRGDGYSNVVRLQRGASSVSVKVAWQVFEEAIGEVAEDDFGRSIMRGVARGIMNGVG